MKRLDIIKTIFPRIKAHIVYDFRRYYRRFYKFLLSKRISILQNKALKKLKNKKIIRCVFFVSEVADWKCDSVYLSMLAHPRFEPIILIIPIVSYGKELMRSEIYECCAFFKSKKYQFISAYNFEESTYVDVKKELSPDLIFYSCPYEGQTDLHYYIDKFPNTLGVYLPYGFSNNCDYSYQYNLFLHNIVWRFYLESDEHMSYCKSTSNNKGRNAVVSGYPAVEKLIDNHVPSQNFWNTSNILKRIIWAPHHTIQPEGNVAYSCFLNYSDFMVELAEKYKESIQIVFKPHPLLRTKLYKLWGKQKTDLYYQKWKEMPNTSFAEGDYVDLFLTSDAMIHDSGSFLIEYLYVNKPVLRTLNEIPLEKLFNPFTLKCLDQYYFAHNCHEIESFVINVINNNDPLKEQRTEFVNNVLMPKGLPSQNIINDILDSIDNQILYRN